MEKFKNFFTREKIIAFSIHFGISFIIFLVLLYLILFEWYPEPLFSTDGGWQGIRLIAFVDIVLGPVLTFLIYKKNKLRLKIDLSIIAVIQLSALFSGTMLVYNEHPVAVVILDYRLYPITAYHVKKAKISRTSLNEYSDLSPPLIYINLPTDPELLIEIISNSFKNSRELRLHGEFYEKLTLKSKILLRQNALNMQDFLKNKPKDLAVYQQFLKNNSDSDRSLIYFPIYSRYVFGIAVLDNATFEIIKILDIYPPNL